MNVQSHFKRNHKTPPIGNTNIQIPFLFCFFHCPFKTASLFSSLVKHPTWRPKRLSVNPSQSLLDFVFSHPFESPPLFVAPRKLRSMVYTLFPLPSPGNGIHHSFLLVDFGVGQQTARMGCHGGCVCCFLPGQISARRAAWNYKRKFFFVRHKSGRRKQPTLKALTSLNKESRPFFLGDNSIWSMPSLSSLSDCSIWRSWRLF